MSTKSFQKAIQKANEGARTIAQQVRKLEVIPTGILSLDYVLLDKLGGLPRGATILIDGKPDAGKSVLTYRFEAAAQKLSDTAAIVHVDSEGRTVFDSGTEWMVAQGVDPERAALLNSKDLEECLEFLKAASEIDETVMLVWDTVTNCYTQKEGMADRARMMVNKLPKLMESVEERAQILIVVAQMRDVINIGGYGGRGPSLRPGVPKILLHGPNLKLRIWRAGTITYEDDDVGFEMGINVLSSKYPGRRGRRTGKHCPPIAVSFDGAWDTLIELVELAKHFKLLKASGAWLSYKDIKAQGSVKFVEALSENPELTKQLKKEILHAI